MPYIKKLSVAPVFLVIFSLTTYHIAQILNSYEVLFSLDAAAFSSIIIISALFLLSGLSFVLFATFANNWRFVLPVVAVALSLPLIFIPQPLSFIISVGFLAAFVISFLSVENKLKSYLTFHPSELLIPTIKSLSSFLILVTAFGFYLSSSAEIKKNGFSVPDSLIDSVLKAIPQPNMPTGTMENNQTANQLLQTTEIGEKEIALLKQNPQLLEQYGVDPEMLDSLDLKSINENVTSPVESTVKNLVKAQLDQTLKPYLSFIPAFLAVSLFLTINWIASILGLFLSPFIWAIFEILTKTGFATFTTETREVKKLVV